MLTRKHGKPIVWLVFQEWEIVLEKSRGAKSESLFHTVCYHNHMDTYDTYNHMKEKIKLSSRSQRPRLSSNKTHSYNDQAMIKNSLGRKKPRILFPRDGIYHALPRPTTPWLQVCNMGNKSWSYGFLMKWCNCE